MATVYFVAAVTNGAAVLAKSKEVYGNDAVFRLADDKFFIHSSETSMDVSTKIGVRTGETGSGLVFKVTTYNGRATPSLWEWLTPRIEK